jgi:peroxiredoxin
MHTDQPLPKLTATLAEGGAWRLAEEAPKHFTLLCFYRGLHCPICRTYLGELARLEPDFTKRGTGLIALSAEPAERVAAAKREWGIAALRMAGGVSIEDARAIGLYVSRGRGANAYGVAEPEFFIEPALVLARPDGKLYAAWVQSAPYARPHPAEILVAVDNFLARELPRPRGAD